jgi:hypothetical protein
LDDCCVSIIYEEDVLVSATEAIKMELPGNGMNSWLADGTKSTDLASQVDD